MVDNMMLQPEEERRNVEEVAKRFKEILDEPSLPPANFPEIQGLLEEIDVEAESAHQAIPAPLITTDQDPDACSEVAEQWPYSRELPHRSSEDFRRSISVLPTAHRSPFRPMSANSEGQWNNTLLRVYSDPKDRNLRRPGWHNQRNRLTRLSLAMAMTPIHAADEDLEGWPREMSDVRNWCQVEEGLEEAVKRRSLTIAKLKFDRAASVRELAKALTWSYKKGEVTIRGKAEDDALTGYFVDRDIVRTCRSIEPNYHYNKISQIFLVDNGRTMAQHWHEARYLLRVLVWRCLGYDEDGIELYFTNPGTNVEIQQSKDQIVDQFIDAMDKARPSEDEHHRTNIEVALAEIMNRHARDLIKHGGGAQQPKNKTIIVLTDGIWEGSTDEGVNEFFKHHLRSLHRSHRLYDPSKCLSPAQSNDMEELDKTRPLTFQFVRFGFNKEAWNRLRHLDDDLKAKHGV
jgi:hypothetical protein